MDRMKRVVEMIDQELFRLQTARALVAGESGRKPRKAKQKNPNASRNQSIALRAYWRQRKAAGAAAA